LVWQLTVYSLFLGWFGGGWGEASRFGRNLEQLFYLQFSYFEVDYAVLWRAEIRQLFAEILILKRSSKI
jgi:hypothetical protein